MKKNQVINIKIEDITNLGFGVGRYEGAVVFVSGAVPGDEVQVKIIKAASSYYVGKLESFIARSTLRGEDRCDNTKCRACAYREIRYEEELKIKENIISSAFRKVGLADVRVHPTVPSPSSTEYRNKAQYPIAKDKNGRYVIGFYAPKSHNVCEAARCPMAPSVFGDIIEELRTFFKKHDLTVYNENDGKGLLRHIYIRRGEVSGEILLTIVINGDKLPHSDEMVEALTKKFPAIVGILLNENRENTNIILGDTYKTLYGRNYIYDTLCGVRLKLTAPAFYQVNHGAAELLYGKAKELAELSHTDTLIDLYCGAGSIGLSMADAVKELYGIEIVESAVECAKENARENGITNAKFYIGDAKDAQKLLASAELAEGKRINPDVIVLDPPRAGCDEELIKYVASLSPRRVVYISCNPSTLARDVVIFGNLGYKTADVFGFDLFPGTGHDERVVCLTKQTN